MLYSMLNPATGATVGRVNAEAQVGAGSVITGAVGNITVVTILLPAHDPVPGVPAVIAPQLAERTYLACTV
jgi:hypothetical protein